MLIIIYVWLGYWAAGLVIYHNKIVFRRLSMLFIEKLILGLFLGWLLIPIAVIMKLVGAR